MTQDAPVRDARGLPEVLARRAARTPRDLAFAFLDRDLVERDRVTYADLHRRASAVAMALRSGLPAGAHVLLLLPPGIDQVAAVFGCLSAGVVAVSAVPPAGLRAGRALPRLRALVADASAQGVLSTGLVRSVVRGFGGVGAGGREPVWFEVDTMGRTAADPARGATLARPATALPAAPGADDRAFLRYASESTQSGAVLLSHGNLMANCAAIAAAFGTSGESVLFNWLPPYHDMGLLGGILHPVYAGAPCYLTAPATVLRRPLRWLEGVSRYGATFTAGPDRLYDVCARRVRPGEADRLDLSCLQVALSGAEAVRAETLEMFAAAFGPAGFRPSAFAPAYGMAESTSVLTTSGLDGAVIGTFDPEALRTGRALPARPERGVRLVGCGYPAPRHDVVVVDPRTRTRCPDGVIGEIWGAGPSVAAGYWRASGATSAMFQAAIAGEGDRGPYLRTGDLGFLRAGELFVTARRAAGPVTAGIGRSRPGTDVPPIRTHRCRGGGAEPAAEPPARSRRRSTRRSRGSDR